MSVEHFDEPAHVSSLEFLGQINIHPDRGNRVLRRTRLVPDLNRKAQAANANLVNREFAMIPFALLVLQFDFPIRFGKRGYPAMFRCAQHAANVAICGGICKKISVKRFSATARVLLVIRKDARPHPGPLPRGEGDTSPDSSRFTHLICSRRHLSFCF
jgi:hypothetical protein